MVARRIADAPSLCGTRSVEGLEVVVTGITHDSRRVRPGDLYVALPGARTHGARFCEQAETRGAVAILTDEAGARIGVPPGIPVIQVSRPRAILGDLSAWAYGNPADDLTMIGVTGTNGKTTTTYLLEAGLSAAGLLTGVIGTTGVHVGPDRWPSARTTPEAPDLHALLGVMRDARVTHVAMEVSSHALALGRLDGVVFDLAAFTNLSQDHLDFHASMQDYYAAKAGLFDPGRAESALICVDDDWGRRLASGCQIPARTYSLVADADWTIGDLEVAESGAWEGIAVGPGGVRTRLGSGLPGRFNQANALGALACCAALGIDLAVAADGIRECRGVPGRMEVVVTGDYCGIVDYAHSPDSVARAIETARHLSTGRVLVAIGCGGDRDSAKRGDMGRAAAAGSDLLVVTDDNPRSEEPGTIRAAVLDGVARVPSSSRPETVQIADRRAAIGFLVSRASRGDVVLVLGKGDESGQEVSGVVYPFDDREVLAELAAEGRNEA
ncbi:MAG: UDP-N-acetylmuramoyl-L-alanyl-D-glutamate--2,6-diaminopimelate ligase [Candidatus Nanopelagicales bacterium]|nr:UDP-N-acetylmuramoyl-L-alanyl-D-glutamate--2,6-diaminopimelate ligase [Candidatus Nanopelagicales bacterium]